MLFGHNDIACRVFRTRKTLAAQGTGRRDWTDGQTAKQTGKTEQAADKRSRQDRAANARKGRMGEWTDGRMDGWTGQDWRTADEYYSPAGNMKSPRTFRFRGLWRGIPPGIIPASVSARRTARAR